MELKIGETVQIRVHTKGFYMLVASSVSVSEPYFCVDCVV